MATLKNSVFLDSNYIIASYADSDPLYQKATVLSKHLTSRQGQLVISNYILLEVVTILSQRVGKKHAHDAGKYLLESGRVQNIQQTSSLDYQTWDLFQTVRTKNLSFVDASIIATMLAEGIKHLITFDKALASIAKLHRLEVN